MGINHNVGKKGGGLTRQQNDPNYQGADLIMGNSCMEKMFLNISHISIRQDPEFFFVPASEKTSALPV